jgi:hypothetical protein
MNAIVLKVKSKGRTVLHIKSWKTNDHEKKHSAVTQKSSSSSSSRSIMYWSMWTKLQPVFKILHSSHRTHSGTEKRIIAIYTHNQTTVNLKSVYTIQYTSF